MDTGSVICDGYWRYLGKLDVPKITGSMKPIDPAQLDYGGLPLTEYTESHSTPRILTRAEKGQALTHLEMDFNLASLFHKLNTSSEGAPYTPEEESEQNDVYYERRKPTREQEMEGLFVTFSYAPIKDASQSLIQNPFQTVKVQHTTDEIRYKLSNEIIPGTLDIAEDFHVTGSTYIAQDLSVSGNVNVKGDVDANTLRVRTSASIEDSLRVEGTASFSKDVFIEGNLYVNGVMFGNLSQRGYNSLENPGYVQQYQRYGTQDTGSQQSDIALKTNLVPLQGSLDKIGRITGYRFDWKPEAEKQGHDVGLIAQDVLTVLPEAVDEGLDGYLRINYLKVIPLLVEAIKELKEEVRCLKNQ